MTETPRSKLILDRGVHTVDHVALGVSDTASGAAVLARWTGAAPIVTDPEPGAWYHSAALPLRDGNAVEIIGPNLQHAGFHPFAELLRGLARPTPLFWYVATDDFASLVRRAAEVGTPVERIEHINADDDPRHPRYVRGILGPGFVSQRPCVIGWHRRSHHGGETPRCRLEDLGLSHPQAAALNRLFAGLGIVERVVPGPRSMTLTLDTPRGHIDISGPGVALAGLGALAQMTRLWFRHRLRRAGRAE